MHATEVLEHLKSLAETLEVDIICERLCEDDFRAKGGLCKIKGRYKIFLDRSQPVENQISILAKALSSFDTEGLYLLPRIRDILERAQRLR